MKTLIFFTSQFPYGSGESFIENEFPFLLNEFERIFIVTNDLSSVQTRLIPTNLKVIRYPYLASFKAKIMAMGQFLFLANEVKFMLNFGVPINKATLSTLFSTYSKTIEINSFINRLIREENISTTGLTLYSYWMNDMASGIALFKKNNPTVKGFCRAHGWDVYFERHSPPYLPLRNFIISNLNAIYCISKNGRDYLNRLTSYGYAGKIHLSHLGTFNNSEVLSPPNSGKLKLLSCSNLLPLKRIHLIIEALALIDDFEVEWTHFGAGPLKRAIEKLAFEKLSRKKNIRFEFAGQISNEILLKYYSDNAIDAIISVSESEGLPVSIMEANSFGVPAIATNVGGVPEIVCHNENGILLDPKCNSKDIEKAIRDFNSLSFEERNKLRTNAFNSWTKNFNGEMNFRNFISSIRTI